MTTLVLVLLGGAGACSNPSGPTPPPPTPDAPTLSCPTDILVEQAEPSPAVVDYALPQASGGAAPVTVSCQAPPGTSFALGSSEVRCEALDSLARRAQCGFRVNVSLIPRLKATNILAFGDSITWGQSSDAVAFRVLSATVPGTSYPDVLSNLLTSRYKAQTPVVTNEGVPSERFLVNGEVRLEGLVRQRHPDVVLLLEGVNDLNSGADPEDVGDALRRGVRRAVREGTPLVIVSTILPGVQGRTKPPDPDKVNALNAEIRSWAGAERAVLLDNYAVFDPQKEQLIGADGLHPTIAGYHRLGESFFEAIKQHFEVPPPAPAATLGLRGTRR